MKATCCSRAGVRRLIRRGGDTAGWVSSATLLLVLPKCPACLAGYIALATGLAVSVPTAATLRVLLLAISVISLSYFLSRNLRRNL